MYGWRARIGLIYPDSGRRDHDCYRMAPPGVSVHFTRVKFSGQGTLADIGAMSETSRLVEAAQLLKALEPHCISWLDTSGSFMFGPDGDRAQVEAIGKATGVPASTTSTATLAAFEALDVERIAVAAPYLNEINEQLQTFMEATGVRVARMRALELDWEGDVSRVTDEAVYALAREAYTSEAQALFIPCTDFGNIDLIDQLETDLGIPVVTSNQATMWHALRLCGIRDSVAGFGRLLTIDAKLDGARGLSSVAERRKSA